MVREHRWGAHTEKEMDVKHKEENEELAKTVSVAARTVVRRLIVFAMGRGFRGAIYRVPAQRHRVVCLTEGMPMKPWCPGRVALTPYRPLHVL